MNERNVVLTVPHARGGLGPDHPSDPAALPFALQLKHALADRVPVHVIVSAQPRREQDDNRPGPTRPTRPTPLWQELQRRVTSHTLLLDIHSFGTGDTPVYFLTRTPEDPHLWQYVRALVRRRIAVQIHQAAPENSIIQWAQHRARSAQLLEISESISVADRARIAEILAQELVSLISGA